MFMDFQSEGFFFPNTEQPVHCTERAQEGDRPKLLLLIIAAIKEFQSPLDLQSIRSEME